MNYISIDFVECSPAPVNGWNVQYRIAGSGDPYTDAGNFGGSPAVIAADDAPGTDYEGIIRSDCCESGETDCMGNDIPWTTVQEESSSGTTTPCFTHVFQVFGSDGESVHITGTLCNGDPYEYLGLVGDGAPASVCLQIGTVDTHASFVVVVNDTEPCP